MICKAITKILFGNSEKIFLECEKMARCVAGRGWAYHCAELTICVWEGLNFSCLNSCDARRVDPPHNIKNCFGVSPSLRWARGLWLGGLSPSLHWARSVTGRGWGFRLYSWSWVFFIPQNCFWGSMGGVADGFVRVFPRRTQGVNQFLPSGWTGQLPGILSSFPRQLFSPQQEKLRKCQRFPKRRPELTWRWIFLREKAKNNPP